MKFDANDLFALAFLMRVSVDANSIYVLYSGETFNSVLKKRLQISGQLQHYLPTKLQCGLIYYGKCLHQTKHYRISSKFQIYTAREQIITGLMTMASNQGSGEAVRILRMRSELPIIDNGVYVSVLKGKQSYPIKPYLYWISLSVFKLFFLKVQ